jgi:hypothetical protein
MQRMLNAGAPRPALAIHVLKLEEGYHLGGSLYKIGLPQVPGTYYRNAQNRYLELPNPRLPHGGKE